MSTLQVPLYSLTLLQLKKICKSLNISSKGTQLDLIQRIADQQVVSRTRLYKPNGRPNGQPTITQSAEIATKFREYDIKRVTWIQKKWKKKLEWRKSIVNQTDFASLEPLTCPFIFYIIDQLEPHESMQQPTKSHIYQFDPLQLGEYFIREGNFCNPYTRKMLHSVELIRLDRLIDKHRQMNTLPVQFNGVSFHKMHKEIMLARAQEREHIGTCLLLHNDSEQIINRILRLGCQEPSLEKCFDVLTRTYLFDYFVVFRQLYALDIPLATRSFASTVSCLIQCKKNHNIAFNRNLCILLDFSITQMRQFFYAAAPPFSNIMDRLLDDLLNLPSLYIRR